MTDHMRTTDRLFLAVREQLINSGLLELRGQGFNATQMNEIASWAARQIVRRVRIMRSGTSCLEAELAALGDNAPGYLGALRQALVEGMAYDLAHDGAVEFTEEPNVQVPGPNYGPTRLLHGQLLVLNPNMDVVR